MVVNIFFR